MLSPHLTEQPMMLPDPPPSAKDVCPPKYKDVEDRQKLALRICSAIRLGIEQKGDLKDRIRRNEEFYENRNIKPRSVPWKDAPHFHIPFTKPRISKRAASLVQTILAPGQVFRFKRIGEQESVSEIEQAVQFTLDAQDWQQDLAMAAQIAMICNNVMLRVTFQEHPKGFDKATHTGPFAGPVIDVIHPEYASVFPATPGPLSTKRVIAHCSEIRAAEIRAAQNRGEYFDDVTVTGSDERIRAENGKDGDLQDFSDLHEEDSDANINLWDGLWKGDLEGKGKEKWYRVICRLDGDTLFRIEEYPDDLPIWYVMAQIDKEYGVLWTEGGPAQDLQGLQVLLNATVNQFYWTLQRLANATVLSEQSSADNGEFINLPPGAMVPVKNLGKTQVITGAGSLQGSDLLISLIRQFGDSAVNVSDALSGAPSTDRDSTATEQNIKLMGFQLAGSADVTAISPALVQVAKLILALITKYWDRFSDVYGEAIAIEDPAILSQPYVIELAGKSPEDAPQAQMEQARLLAELATQFPEAGIPVVPLLRTIILATSLPNKEDLIQVIDEQAEMMQGMTMQPEQLMQAMMGGNAQMEGGGIGPDGFARLLEELLMASGQGMAAEGPPEMPPPIDPTLAA